MSKITLVALLLSSIVSAARADIHTKFGTSEIVNQDQLPANFAIDQIENDQIGKRLEILPNDEGLKIYSRIPGTSKFKVEMVPGKVRFLQLPETKLKVVAGNQLRASGSLNVQKIDDDFYGYAIVGETLLSWSDPLEEHYHIPHLDQFSPETRIEVTHPFVSDSYFAIILKSPETSYSHEFVSMIAPNAEGAYFFPNWGEGNAWVTAGETRMEYAGGDRIVRRFGISSTDAVGYPLSSVAGYRKELDARALGDGHNVPIPVQSVPQDRDFLVGITNRSGELTHRIELLPNDAGLIIYKVIDAGPQENKYGLLKIPGHVVRFEVDMNDPEYEYGTQLEPARRAGIIKSRSGALSYTNTNALNSRSLAALVGSQLFNWTLWSERYYAPELGELGPNTKVEVGTTKIKNLHSRGAELTWFITDPNSKKKYTLLFARKADPMIFEGHVRVDEPSLLNTYGGGQAYRYGNYGDESNTVATGGRYLRLISADETPTGEENGPIFTSDRKTETVALKPARPLEPDRSGQETGENEDSAAQAAVQDEVAHTAPGGPATRIETMIAKVKTHLSTLLEAATSQKNRTRGQIRPAKEMAANQALFRMKLRHLQKLERCRELLEAKALSQSPNTDTVSK